MCASAPRGDWVCMVTGWCAGVMLMPINSSSGLNLPFNREPNLVTLSVLIQRISLYKQFSHLFSC